MASARACGRWLVLLLVCALSGTQALAAEERTLGVIIGISEYQDSLVLPRPHAEDDAKALYDLLTDPERAACKQTRLRLLLGKEDAKYKAQKATRDNILAALQWLDQEARQDDTVVVCWIGQGVPLGDRACYLALDSTIKERAKTAVTASDIEHFVDSLKARRLVVLLDVYFLGYHREASEVSGSLERIYSEWDGSDDSSQHPEMLSILASGDGMRSPLVEKGHGLFMELVLEGLSGQADREGGQADGHITFDELAVFVGKEMPKRSQALVPEDKGPSRAYRPVVLQQGASLTLLRNPAVARKVDKDIERFLELAGKAKFAPEIVNEGKELLTHMPKLANQRKLRDLYQALVAGQIAPEEFLEKRRIFIEQFLRLHPQVAENFAADVLRVAQLVQSSYVRVVPLDSLVAEAIRGLYQQVQKQLPDDLKAKLARITPLEKALQNRNSAPPESGLSQEELRHLLIAARTDLGKREDLDRSRDVSAALNFMLHKLDRYSSFIDPEEVEEFKRQTQQAFIGVGIQIQKDTSTEYIRVVTPIRNSPAYKAGIQAGDLIAKVINLYDKNGQKLDQPEVTDTKPLSTAEAVKKILGKEGTPVKLVIVRKTQEGDTAREEQKEIEIVRGEVEVETVLGFRRRSDDSWDYYIDPAHKIAYIRLTQFALHTERDLRLALEQLKKQGLNGLILDLRFNPGGYLDSAVDIADMFIDDGAIVTIKPRRGQPHTFRGHREGSYLGFPMVVLINNLSASASEIVSACIQDHGRGIVMGERSFGKASVQNINGVRLSVSGKDQQDQKEEIGQLKITTATFHRPSGKNLDRYSADKEKDEWGVKPLPEHTITLDRREREELFVHLREQEVIRHEAATKQEKKDSKFVDRQLEAALKFLQQQVAGTSAMKKAG